MIPGVAVALRCAAAFSAVHPAPGLALHRRGAARLARARPGMAARGLRQPGRFRLHGVVCLPVENIWQFMRDNWLSNRVFKSYDDLVDHCCEAWNRLTDQPWRIMSIGLRDWAHGF